MHVFWSHKGACGATKKAGTKLQKNFLQVCTYGYFLFLTCVIIQAELDAIEEKKRKKEQEIEERERARQEAERSNRDTRGPADKYRPPNREVTTISIIIKQNLNE